MQKTLVLTLTFFLLLSLSISSVSAVNIYWDKTDIPDTTGTQATLVLIGAAKGTVKAALG